MKNRFIVSILEALEQISAQRPAMGRSEVLRRLSTIDNMAWQVLDDIRSDSHQNSTPTASVMRAHQQHCLNLIERN
jgi:hypothetical protein